jgi:phage tail-like protein
MAGEQEDPLWPVPKFQFKVTIGDLGQIAFEEVSGLDTDYGPIEYRAGNSSEFSMVKMPEMRKSSDITLKKGMFKDDTKLFDYFREIRMNTIKRVNVTIQLLDEEHQPMFTWNLENAYPIRIAGVDLNAQSAEVAVEILVLAYESLTIKEA